MKVRAAPLEITRRVGQSLLLVAGDGRDVDIVVHEVERRGGLLLVGGAWSRIDVGNRPSVEQRPDGRHAAIEMRDGERCTVHVDDDVAGDAEVSSALVIRLGEMPAPQTVVLEVTVDGLFDLRDANVDEPVAAQEEDVERVTSADLLDAWAGLEHVEVRGVLSRERVAQARTVLMRAVDVVDAANARTS